MNQALRIAEAKRRRADLRQLGDEIAELSAHIQAATYRLVTLIREFDERQGWGGGFHSCAHWLSWRIGLNLGAAREKVRVARALADLPLISEAMRKGEVSYSKVRALTRVATPTNEAELMRFARAGTAAHVEKLVRLWRRIDRLTEAKEEKRRYAHRYLQAYTDEDGMVVLRARLEPETGAVLLRALEAATDRLYENSKDKHTSAKKSSAETSFAETSLRQRRADALGIVAESALENGLDPGTRGDRYQVVVHVDEGVLKDPESPGQSVLQDGQRISAETSRRLACEASRVVMRNGPDGSVLDVGRKTRTVPPALRRVLVHRDGGCRFPGCGCRICDAHHVKHWAEGGKTSLDNLVLLCRGHHRAVHEGGFRMELLPDGEMRFYGSRGLQLPYAPATPPLGSHPVEELEQRHREEGLQIGPWTSPVWAGDHPDWDWALEGLRRR